MKIIFLISILIISLFGCNNDSNGESILKKDTPNSVSETVTFPSKDGLTITADLYQTVNHKGFVVLCHQAGYSRGEYLETARKLNELGFSCIAIDQRSGNSANNITNETAKLAKLRGLPTSYLDAQQDIEAAIDYTYELNDNQPVFLVGSSYSASLVLLISTNNDRVKAVASFSPGEYLTGVNLAMAIADINIPVFVTSSKGEIGQVAGVIENMKPEIVTHLKPAVEGIHGSRALWSSTDGNEIYWQAFTNFLNK